MLKTIVTVVLAAFMIVFACVTTDANDSGNLHADSTSVMLKSSSGQTMARYSSISPSDARPDPKALKCSGDYYAKGMELYGLGRFEQAKAYFSAVAPYDMEHYDLAQFKLATCLKKIKNAYLEKAGNEFGVAHYLEVRSEMEQALSEFPGDEDLTALWRKASDAHDNPVLYDGPVYHIFFHDLIVYPELCFTGDSMSQGYNKWMITVSEFKAILEQLYDRGYVLVDIKILFSPDSSGKMKKYGLYLPEGAKPLILSVDDISYEDYRKTDGFASRLVLDDGGEVATLVRTPEGKEIVTRDGDVMPILDDFIKYHPDFSWGNAKGILAVNGYQGILGYRTARKNENWKAESEGAAKVVERLKATGWDFACHSYSHTHQFSNKSISLAGVQSDTEKWLTEVEPVTGPTSIYVTPFGIEFQPGDPRQQYLVSQGFDIFCDVGYRPFYALHDTYALMERIDVDGYKMNFGRKYLAPLFDIDTVYDPSRPPMEK